MSFAAGVFSEKTGSNAAYYVYSCGDGVVNMHDPYKLNNDAVKINEHIAKTNNLEVSMI